MKINIITNWLESILRGWTFRAKSVPVKKYKLKKWQALT